MVKAAREARFTANGDNTVTDKNSGLLIVQDPTQLGEDFQRAMTYEEAEKAIAALNEKGHAGFKDWRLPTVEELCGMLDRTKHDPCYDTGIFKGKFDNWYWSGDQCAWTRQEDGSYTAAWCVGSNAGTVSNVVKDDHNYVRPVRSSQ